MPRENRTATRRRRLVLQKAALLKAALLLAAGFALAAPGLAEPATGPAARGKDLYEGHCAVCHGADGHADTPLGRVLKPAPRNFSDPTEMTRLSYDDIFLAIRDGKPGSAMSAWGSILAETEIADVVDYVRSLAPRPDGSTAGAMRLSLQIGKRVFERECSSCHGMDGHAGTEIARLLRTPPRNFSDPIEMARLEDGRMFLAIFRGKPGTAMGGQGQLLARAEIIDLIRYIRTLAPALPADMTPGQLDYRVGERVYQQNCISCHGEAGDGKSPVGSLLSPPPADLRKLALGQAASDEDRVRIVTKGVPGSAMASWENVLSKQDIRRVVVYLNQRFGGR